MRINVYSQELTAEAQLIEKESNTGRKDAASWSTTLADDLELDTGA